MMMTTLHWLYSLQDTASTQSEALCFSSLVGHWIARSWKGMNASITLRVDLTTTPLLHPAHCVMASTDEALP